MKIDDESLEMNIFEKLMEVKHKEIVSNIEDDSTSINRTNTLSHSGQNHMSDKSCLDNYYYYYDDEIFYPFSRIIKLKHEPEAGQENKPAQYTADIIVEIKNIDGTVVPMRALLHTGITATIILREFLGTCRSCTNTKTITKWKTLAGL
jgi:hypothetical protein